LAPRLNARLYGIQIDKDKSPETDAVVAFLMRGSGSLILGLGIVSWLVQNAASIETNVAVALSNIFVVNHLLCAMIHGVPGIPTTMFAIGIALAAMGSVLPLVVDHQHGQ